MKEIIGILALLILIVLAIIFFWGYYVILIKRAFNWKEDKISFKESMDLTGLPILVLYQGDRKFNFILDSGATNSAFNVNSIEGVKGTIVDSEGTAFGVDGIVHEVKHIRVPLFYNNKEFEETFQVIDLSQAFEHVKKENGVTLHGILGNSFLAKYRYILDFDKMIAYQKM